MEIRVDGPVQRLDVGLFVVTGRDDGDERGTIRHHSRLSAREG